jgi:transcriptional regulator with XRE-family HTH domain
MPKKPEKKRHLTQLREALDLNQAEFARRLGVSASMIKKVEEGTRAGSEDLKARIYAETGLMFFNRDEVANLPAKPFAYSKAQHQAWLQEVQFNQPSAAAAARVILRLVELMLLAAARPGVHKSYQAFNGLLLAIERVKEEFGLEKHLEAEMRDRHMTETRRFTVRELRADAALARLWHFQDDRKLKPDETVLVEKTTKWFPGREINHILSQHRELISEILQTQDGELSAEAKAKLEVLNQKIEKEIEGQMAKFMPPGSLVK